MFADSVASSPEPFGAEFAGGSVLDDTISSDEVFDALFLVVVVTFYASLAAETSECS